MNLRKEAGLYIKADKIKRKRDILYRNKAV